MKDDDGVEVGGAERKRQGQVREEHLLCLLTIHPSILNGAGPWARGAFWGPVPTWTVGRGGGIFRLHLWHNFGILGRERRFRISRPQFAADIR